jgi:dihydrolipoamide dehydrogenase
MTNALPELSVDVAVIGAGTAGLAAYRAAAARTPRVVLIESGPHGTTCARVGCMPRKLLIAAADAAHEAQGAARFGLRTTVAVDGRAVMDRVKRERDRFVGFVLEGVERIPEERRIQGRARFASPGVLDVEGQRVRARAVVIATGSTPAIPPVFAGLGDRLAINDDVFSWDDLPASVAVFGAGVIGLELGQSLARLGVRVRLFGQAGSIGPLTDPAVKEAARAAFAAEFPVSFDARVLEARRAPDGIEIVWVEGASSAAGPGEPRTERFEVALIATGRRPNFGGLNLEAAGVALDKSGVPAFNRRTLQCGASPVFIAGDANQDVPLLHEAADEGAIAGENAATFPDVRAADRRSPLAVIFSDPQIAMIGERYAAVAARGGFVAGEVSFVDQGRSRVMGKNQGMLRVYADVESGRFLGAEMAGPRAENIGHLLAWAHQQQMTIDRMLTMPFYHPVVEEGLRTALRDASARLAAARAAALNTTHASTN